MRPPEQQLRRHRRAIVENPNDRLPFDLDIFRDAAHYWSIVHILDIHSTGAIGAKVVSEHRLENFRASVPVAWFEIERWLVAHGKQLGLDVYVSDGNDGIKRDETGALKYRNISQIINLFPLGTWVYANRDQFHRIRSLRNQIAHKGYEPTQAESSEALHVFMNMFNYRTGLNLSADTNRVPTQGVS